MVWGLCLVRCAWLVEVLLCLTAQRPVACPCRGPSHHSRTRVRIVTYKALSCVVSHRGLSHF